jgi:VRR-NUC domain
MSALPAPTPRPTERRRDGNAEARVQAAVVAWVGWVAPQVVVFHVPNGGLRSKSEAARLRWVGTLAGVLDLVLVLPEGRCSFWEVKAERGMLSADQKAFIARLERSGHSWALVRSIDDARRELAKLGIRTREAFA